MSGPGESPRPIIHRAAWLVLVALLCFGSSTPPGADVGLTYRPVSVPGGGTGHLITIDLRGADLRVLDARDYDARSLTARQFLDRSGATAVFNGPFFDVDGSPMGLLVVDGERRNPLRPVDWGVFSVGPAGATVSHTRDHDPSEPVEQAFQVGPRLVVDGAALPLKDQRSRRTSLCVLPDGRVEALVHGEALSLRDLAAFWVQQGCRDALNLRRRPLDPAVPPPRRRRGRGGRGRPRAGRRGRLRARLGRARSPERLPGVPEVSLRRAEPTLPVLPDDRLEVLPADGELESERIVAGRYRLRRLLGRGGMGAVYLADQVLLDRLVAVKMLLASRARNSRARRRLHREARAVARLSHPNVVQVYDYGEAAEGWPYLVMEFVEGTTGEGLGRERWSTDQVLDVADGLLLGLGAAHARGVLHRDLKPANLLLRGASAQRPVLLDFGIAAVLQDTGLDADPDEPVPDDPDGVLTRPGAVVGTPRYMSPEQAMGRVVAASSDLYSVGVMLYEWLCGRPPFEGSPVDVMKAHVRRDVPVPTPGPGKALWPELQGVMMQALQKRPDQRFSSAGHLRAALASARSDRPGPAFWSAPAAATSDTGLHTARPRLEPALVGRDGVLKKLGARLAAAEELGAGCVVLVHGPLGVGKSRLLRHLVEGKAEEGRWRVGRGAERLGSSGELGALRAAVAETLGLGRPESDPDVLLRGGEGVGEAGLSRAEVSTLLAWLGGRSDVERSADAWYSLLERALRALASAAPVLLCVDELDPDGRGSARFLSELALAQGLSPFPLVVVAAARGGASGGALFEALARFDGGPARFLALKPLPQAAAVALVRGVAPLDPELAGRVAHRSGGLPLFAVQLVGQLLDAGLVHGRRGLVLGDAASYAGLPRSLSRLLGQRVARAVGEGPRAPLRRALLEAAAMLGSVLHDGDLERVLVTGGAQLAADDLDEAIDHMVRVGVLTEPPGADPGLLGWSHGLLREAVLEGLGGQRRARRVAQASAEALLASAAEPRAVARPVAELLLLAGERAQAVPHALVAGRQARAHGDLRAAGELLERLDPIEDRALRAEALWERIEVDMALGLLDLVERWSRELLAAADHDLGRARALFAAGRVRIAQARHPQALQSLRAAEVAAARSDAPEALELRGRILRGVVACAGEVSNVELPTGAEGLLSSGLSSDGRIQVQVTLGYLALRRGQGAEAARWLDAARAGALRAGDRSVLAEILADLGWARRVAGDAEGARQALERALVLAKAAGKRRVEGLAHNGLGELARAAGEPERAAEHYRAAIRLWRALELPMEVTETLNLALVSIEAGRPSEAQELLTPITGRVGELPPRVAGALMLTLALASAALGEQGDSEEALRRGVRTLERLAPPHDDALGVLRHLERLWERDGYPLAEVQRAVARLSP